MSAPNQALQEEERFSIQAIFDGDWHDIPPKKTAWGTEAETGWWELDVRANDPRVSVRLRGRMTKTYPQQPPPLSLVDPRGLDANHVRRLIQLLEDEAKRLAGGIMIFDLHCLAKDFIEANHIPLPKEGEPQPTLMEERALREEAQRAAEEAQHQAEHEKYIAASAEQTRLLHEKVQLDTSRKEERARQAILEEEERKRAESLSTLSDGELADRRVVLEEPISVDGYEGKWNTWMLFGGKKEALWTTYSAEPAAADVEGIANASFVRATMPVVSVQVIDFPNKFYSTPQGSKKIESLVGEIVRLKDVRAENVVSVLGVKRAVSPRKWERVFVFVEKPQDGTKLRSWVPKDGFEEDVARVYITQILTGLSQIHRSGGTQKILDLDYILLCSAGDNTLLKLSGTGYARRIIDLHRSNPFLRSTEANIPDSWLSPDEIESPHSYPAKRDIWHAGVLLVQLLCGSQAIFRSMNLQALIAQSADIPDAMQDLLTSLLNPNQKKRPIAEEALLRLARVEDEPTRRGVRIAPLSLSSDAKHSPKDILGTSPNFGKSLTSYFPQQSRYRTDFDEVEFLGRGGFGEVVKARNKLDNRSYAIKKIKLRPEDNEQKVHREVVSLSKVSHQHIVRYFGCWMEDVVRQEPPTITETPQSETPTQDVLPAPEEDIFKVNWDDPSLYKREPSRSMSFPRIRFHKQADGSDSSSDSDTDSETDSDGSSDDQDTPDPSQPAEAPRGRPIAVPPKPSMSITGTTVDDSAVQRILYIQMEFVEKQTLREAITAGLTEDEIWRLLRQILQALAHMSSLGIVHRDLKPSNILLDADHNVKIADFGLSTTEMTAMEHGGSLHSPEDDRTSNIGTGLYIAPEVAISRSYDEKADLYSLGIIFFEMCYPFRTGMERAQDLTALRTKSITFPPNWPSNMTIQKDIITRLLQHDPAARPKASQLLSSSLLPSPERQKEYFTSAIAELTNPRSAQYPVLLDALFDSGSNFFSTSNDNRLDDYTYDNEHDDELQVWLTVVIRRLEEVFNRHGAVETYLPLLVPETTLLGAFPDLESVRVLDKNGKIVHLPSNNIIGMARSATRRQIERIKRYHKGYRYADHPAGGQPIASGELSFDIVSPIRSHAAEAELLEVVDKVISEFHGVRGSTPIEYEFHISHETVLATILSAVPDKARPGVLKAFKTLGSGGNTSKLSFSGITGLSRQLQDELQQYTMTGDFETVRSRLESHFSGPSAKRKLGSALDEMARVINLISAMSIRRKVLFRPCLSRNAEFFRGGFMFECVRRGKQREVVAFGGRYDSLLEHFKEPAQQIQSRRVFGVGMSIAVDQLARMVRKYESSLATRLMTKDKEEERSYGYWSPARCDVYVASGAQVELSARLAIVGELWRNGIRADLQYDDDRTLEEVSLECLEQNVLYLVLPRANRPVVKIRSILRRSEEEVPRSDLCTNLRDKIAEQRRIDASYATAEGSIPSAQAAAMSIEPRAAEVEPRLILPPDTTTATKGPKGNKPIKKHHRHTTRSVYSAKASEFATTMKTSLPVFGVDLEPRLLSKMTLNTSWLNSDATGEEAWRLITADLPTADRKYPDIVRKDIREAFEKGEGLQRGGGAWLFSVREARGFLLQLPR